MGLLFVYEHYIAITYYCLINHLKNLSINNSFNVYLYASFYLSYPYAYLYLSYPYASYVFTSSIF